MSDDFFNQSYTPARGATIKSRPNTRPPPPPPGQKRPSTNATSNVSTRRPTSSSTTSSSNGLKSSGGHYANKTSTSSFQNRGNVSSTASNKSNPYGGIGSRSNMTSSRPTGNYYPTSSNDTSEKPAVFQGYNPNPYGAPATESNTAPAAPSLYGNSNNNTAAAPNPYGNLNQSATTDSSRTVQTSNIENVQSSDGDDWFSSAQQEDYNASQGQATSATAAPSYMNPYANTAAANNDSNNYDQVPKRTESVEMIADSMSGPMSGGSNPSIFNPSMTSSGSNNDIASSYNPLDFENEPPLLEELGINIDHIKTKSLAVLFPMKYAKTKIDHEIMEDSDLAGPLAFALILATELLLAGKLQFGYIYGFGLFGCFATTLVLNLMSPKGSISVWQVAGILGYSLLPVNMLAAMNVFYRIKYMGTLGVVFAAITIIWCTLSSTRLVERGCDMRDQRYLIGYPISMLYSAFVMLTIF